MNQYQLETDTVVFIGFFFNKLKRRYSYICQLSADCISVNWTGQYLNLHQGEKIQKSDILNEIANSCHIFGICLSIFLKLRGSNQYEWRKRPMAVCVLSKRRNFSFLGPKGEKRRQNEYWKIIFWFDLNCSLGMQS